MAGAVAAGLTAIASKSDDPKITMLFTFLGVGLAFIANSPRDVHSLDRSTDEHDIARMDDERG
jgi:hypothetical protein